MPVEPYNTAMTDVYLGLGSNLGDREAMLRAALAAISLTLCRGCATHLKGAGLFGSFLLDYLIPSQCQKGRRARYVCDTTALPLFNGAIGTFHF